MTEQPEPIRIRQRGEPVLCPVCGLDMICYHTRLIRLQNAPACTARIIRRVRYYRCADPTCCGRESVRDVPRLSG